MYKAPLSIPRHIDISVISIQKCGVYKCLLTNFNLPNDGLQIRGNTSHTTHKTLSNKIVSDLFFLFTYIYCNGMSHPKKAVNSRI
jgi:hypothetical protein